MFNQTKQCIIGQSYWYCFGKVLSLLKIEGGVLHKLRSMVDLSDHCVQANKNYLRDRTSATYWEDL